MREVEEFERYMEHLRPALCNVTQRAGLKDYCTGLMSTAKRKSVEPMAEVIDPKNTRSKHQSMHHFVAQADWSDEQMLLRVAQWVVPQMDLGDGGWWIVDDTGFPKKGKHSVGVGRQYCGVLGKQDNCQVAVSVSLACAQASLPVAWQLYLPQGWAADDVRRTKAGVPQDIGFETKAAIALRQLKRLMEQGARRHCVLTDAGYGVDTAFREGLTELGLPYIVGITGAITVWANAHTPLASAAQSGQGRSKRLRIGQPEDAQHRPQSAKQVALGLPASQWQRVDWREGTNHSLRSRFARLRVRAAHRDALRTQLRPSEWLLIEWPEGEPEPTKYWLSTQPHDIALQRLVYEAKMRWRIERDYQDLKQDLGLGHYEGRGWRGFHHHASLSIAAYGFLTAQRLNHPDGQAGKKNTAPRQEPALPLHCKPRGSPAHAAPRPLIDNVFTAAHRSRLAQQPSKMPLLRAPQPKT